MRAVGMSVSNDDVPDYRGGERLDMRRFVPVMAAGSKVLEIGCGEGRFSRYMRPTSEVWGIEPFVAAANVAQ